MTTPRVLDIDIILDAASDILTNDGYQAVTLASIASRCGASTADVSSVFTTANEVMVAMLSREFSGMYGVIVQNIESDPRGGLLSRLYTYMLSAVYERPLAKTLFVLDRDALGAEGLEDLLQDRAAHDFRFQLLHQFARGHLILRRSIGEGGLCLGPHLVQQVGTLRLVGDLISRCDIVADQLLELGLGRRQVGLRRHFPWVFGSFFSEIDDRVHHLL